MEVNTQKKILVTYFTNYGIICKNPVCPRIVYKTKIALGDNNKHIKYFPLKTNIANSNLNYISHINLLMELMNANYEYIIAIGLGKFKGPCLLERRDEYKDCYIFSSKDICTQNSLYANNKSNRGFVKINPPSDKDRGACYIIRDTLIYHAINKDKHCKRV